MTADQLGFMDAPALPHPNQMVKVTPVSAASNGYYHARLIQPALSTAIPMSTPSAGVIPRERIKAIDLLSDGAEHTPDEQLSAWLALGANHLSMLLDAGWSSEQVLDSLRVVLQGVQGLPGISRRKLLELGATAWVSGISLSPDSRATESERVELSEALGKSIGDSWKLFHTAGNSQALLVSNTLLYLVKQHHYHIYSNLLPLFYSAVYRLKGAAFSFQGRYNDAWKALEQSYLAALDSADTWNMAQSRSWQAYIWNARGNYAEALQSTKAALRLITQQDDTESIRLRARLLTFGAKNAAMLGDVGEVQKGLEASKKLLEYLPFVHEEFDKLSWFQEAGTCALKLGQYELASSQLQLALTTLPPQWALRYISTSIPLAITQIRLKHAENALAIAQKTLPVVKAVQSVKLTQEFTYCLQAELAATFPNDSHCQAFVTEAQRTLSNS